jgi:translocation and assembly module TamB
MVQDRSTTRLPPQPRTNTTRRDWGRLLAKILCLVFAFIGVLPIASGVVVRSPWARAWATRETARLVLDLGIVASYKLDVHFWPLALELDDVRVESTDRGVPMLTTQHVSIRPRSFALLSGKLAIDQIEVEAPKARLVLRDGKLTNLNLTLPESKDPNSPIHAPFDVFAITDGDVDLDIDGSHLKVHAVDLDVTTEDDPKLGSSFEIAVRAGESTFERTRMTESDAGVTTAFYDEDAICMLDGRIRVDPDAITVHRLRVSASADLDPADGTRPACNLPETDRRRVDLALAHTHVRLPQKKGDLPHLDGHVIARVPIALGGRFAPLPDNDGWVSVDLEARFSEGMILPEVAGRVEAHEVRILEYRFAREIVSDLVTRNNVITSPRTTVRVADGIAVLTDVTVEPLAKGIPIRAKVDVSGALFPALMRDLGVSQHAHVSWDLKEIHVPVFSGTLDPLKLDGEVNAQTANFAVFDKATDSPARTRIIGVKEARVTAHVAVRPTALEFQHARAVMPKGVVDDAFVSIGFHNVLKVQVPTAKLDLSEIGPLGSLPIAGQAEASQVEVTGLFNDPKLEADAKIDNFVLSDIPFGNVTAGHASLDGLVVRLKGVKAQKGKSVYEMPSGKLDFGGSGNLVMDAQVASSNFNLRDFFALWHLEEDPRFLEMDGNIQTSSNVHVALGGPQDKCGGGFIDIDAHAHLRDVKMFGETFEDGDLDLDYEWEDQLAGLAGARIEVHAVTLRKVRPNPAGIAIGTVLGSATLDDGNLSGNVVLQGIPISRIQALGALAPQVDGSVSGFAKVSGTIDAFEVEGDVDVTPVLVRGTRLGASRLHLKVTQEPPKTKPTGKTRCGHPTYPAFDKNVYLADTASAGTFTLDGELLGSQVLLSDVVVTRQLDMRATGKIGFRKLDLGAAARIFAPPEVDEITDAAPPPPIEGELSGDLQIDKLQRTDIAHAAIRFSPTTLSVSRAGQKLVMRPATSILTLADDTLAVPPIVFDLQTQNGLRGAVTVKGSVLKTTRAPELAIEAELAPIDLGVMVGVVPKVDRAQGTLSGSLQATGKATAPALHGFVNVRNGEFVIHGVPSPLGNVEIDVQSDGNEIRITRATARFAGGTVAMTGRVPIRGFTTGAGEIAMIMRGLRLSPQDGVNVTLDADLTLALAAYAAGGKKAPLPHLTGDVLLTSFDYTRPISLTTDLSALGVRARRTVVESYDPSLDAVSIDLHLRSRAPLRIHNNLVEVQLGIESGALEVSGTNQRIGLRGELRAQQGGRFRLRSNEFEVRQAIIRFDDPTRISPNVDVLGITEYRRYGDSRSAAGAGAVAGLWRITLHAYGDTENLRLDMTSDPPLSQEDIVLLLTVGMTRAEVDQLQAGAFGAGAALEALSTVSGADRVVKNAIPVIDDFRFGSGYSSRTGRTEPQVTIGKRITEDVRANVTTGLAEDRELRSNIEWRLGQRTSVQGSYDNVNDVSSSTVGNVGVDFRWRLEFQ